MIQSINQSITQSCLNSRATSRLHSNSTFRRRRL